MTPIYMFPEARVVACKACGCELVEGDRGERSICGPDGLPLCHRDVEALTDECGSAVWADGWSKTDAAKAWLSGRQGRAA